MYQHSDTPFAGNPEAKKEFINIPNANVLATFEEIAARSLYDDPSEFSPDIAWASREKLSNLIKPARFIGRLSDIRIMLLAEPYEQLIEKSTQNKAPIHTEWAEEHTAGFNISGNLNSTGRGVIGSFTTNFWIYRPSSYGKNRSTNRHYYGEIRRRVDKPNTHDVNVDEMIEKASCIGLALLRNNLRHPLLGGAIETRRQNKR